MPKADQAKRNEIMAAASRLFDLRPYHEVRIDDVAADAHVSKGTVYTYFDSKEHLYLSTITEGAETVVVQLEQIAEESSQTPLDRLMQQVDAIVGFALDYPEVYRLQRSGSIDVSRTRLFELARRGQAAMGRVIAAGEESGVFRVADRNMTFYMITGFVGEAVKLTEHQPTHDELTGHVRNILLGGLLNGEKAQ